MPTVAIVGASQDRSKYGNKAVRAYHDAGWEVYPVNLHASDIEGIPAVAHLRDIAASIDRVALYLPPVVGVTVIEEIARAHPREVFFNPGSASDDLIAKAKSLGINPVQACAIVDIGKRPADYT